MARYTAELKDVVLIENIFDFQYEFYDEEKRIEFEHDFVRHFYFREICTESVDRFKIYLEDKFKTVLPFYNELFKTALTKYDLVNNYDMVEQFEKETDSEGKTSGISSTVGQIFDTQETENTQNRTVDSEGNATNNSTQTVEGTNSKNTQTNATGQNVQKFLDTPQGKTDLTDSKYLTSLTQTDTTNNGNGTESGTNKQTTTENGSSETTGKETTVDTQTGNATHEQKTTADGNTRSYSKGLTKDKYTLIRKGNIGVMTASDMMEKHIELQKKLKKISLMFFDDCEDLFMMVY